MNPGNQLPACSKLNIQPDLPPPLSQRAVTPSEMHDSSTKKGTAVPRCLQILCEVSLVLPVQSVPSMQKAEGLIGGLSPLPPHRRILASLCFVSRGLGSRVLLYLDPCQFGVMR